jgi:hypothetical protein
MFSRKSGEKIYQLFSNISRAQKHEIQTFLKCSIHIYQHPQTRNIVLWNLPLEVGDLLSKELGRRFLRKWLKDATKCMEIIQPDSRSILTKLNDPAYMVLDDKEACWISIDGNLQQYSLDTTERILDSFSDDIEKRQKVEEWLQCRLTFVLSRKNSNLLILLVNSSYEIIGSDKMKIEQGAYQFLKAWIGDVSSKIKEGSGHSIYDFWVTYNPGLRNESEFEDKYSVRQSYKMTYEHPDINLDNLEIGWEEYTRVYHITDIDRLIIEEKVKVSIYIYSKANYILTFYKAGGESKNGIR